MGEQKLEYPEGTKFSNFTVIHESQKQRDGATYIVPVIRRVAYLPDGTKKNVRYPTKVYAHLRDNKKALESFVIRLNRGVPEEIRTRREVTIKHAWINDELLQDFKAHLVATIPEERGAETAYGYLIRHALDYFINKLNLASPIDWKANQDKWTCALLNKIPEERKDKIPALWEDGEGRSPSVIKSTTQTLNKFMAWVNARDPHTYPLVVFKPVTSAQFKELKARRKVDGLAVIRRMIRTPHWNTIQEKLEKLPKDSPVRAGINLGYHYGLRRAEIAALQPGDVKQGWISLQRQLKAWSGVKGPTYKPLKGRDARQIPHWQATPKQAYRWAETMHQGLMDLDDFGKDCSKFFADLKMPYTLHDLRHTWTSMVVRHHTVADVMVAAGHKDIATTNRYLHLGEEYDEDAPFIPGED